MKTRFTLLIVVLGAAGMVALGQNSNSTPNPDAFAPVVTGTGSSGHIAKWMSTSAIENSGIIESGAGNVGVGTPTPAAKLDVKGTGAFRDTLSLFPSGADPALSVFGTSFSISSLGFVTFPAGQIFPGTGSVTSVSSGTGLTGGPITTSGTLSVNPSVIPFLASPNTFFADQAISGDLTVDNVFATGVTLEGTAARTIGTGDNPNSGDPGNSLTVTGGGAAFGATDAAGGDLILAAGDGNGAGGSGAVHLQTAPAGASGTTPDVPVDRYYIAPRSVSMGGQVGDSGTLVLINVPDGDAAGVIVRFTIRANDGGSNYLAETGSCIFATANAADGSSSGADYHFGADSATVGFGSVGAYCAAVSGPTGTFGVAVGDALTFVPTTHDLYYEVTNISGLPLSNLALVAHTQHVVVNPTQRVDAQHPNLEIHIKR